MRVYQVVGVERMSGVSKKTNQPYDITIMHLTYEEPANQNLVGKAVCEVRPFRDLLDRCGYFPLVGDLIALQYDCLPDGRARLSGISKWVE